MTHIHQHQQQFAIKLSLAVGVLMLIGKWYAYIITGSAAILSDAAESVVHIIAVAFAAYSMWLSFRPADSSHPYGHDKISYFSAGTEGLLIIVAAGCIGNKSWPWRIFSLARKKNRLIDIDRQR